MFQGFAAFPRLIDWMEIKFQQVKQSADVPSRQGMRHVLLGSLLFLLCAGCANLGREAQRSDGLADFVQAVAGHPREEVVPVERFSERSGEIVAAHAEADHRGGTYVSGILHKGFGYEGVSDANIHIKVFGSDRQLIAALTTDFFPRPIPNDYHGTIGRAWFGVRLPFVPPAGSTIQVSYRRTGQEEFKVSPPDSRKLPSVK